MAESSEKSPQAAGASKEDIDKDLDADMNDVGEETTAQAPEASTSTLDHEPVQTDTQPTGSLPHQNRKDTTLREFLSKMDDYAPVVRSLTPPTLAECMSSCPFLRPSSRCPADILNRKSDPRRSNRPLPNPLRPPTTLTPRPHRRNHKHYTPSPRTPPRPRNPKIHRRHCHRRIPILANPFFQFGGR